MSNLFTLDFFGVPQFPEAKSDITRPITPEDYLMMALLLRVVFFPTGE